MRSASPAIPKPGPLASARPRRTLNSTVYVATFAGAPLSSVRSTWAAYCLRRLANEDQALEAQDSPENETRGNAAVAPAARWHAAAPVWVRIDPECSAAQLKKIVKSATGLMVSPPSSSASLLEKASFGKGQRVQSAAADQHPVAAARDTDHSNASASGTPARRFVFALLALVLAVILAAVLGAKK